MTKSFNFGLIKGGREVRYNRHDPEFLGDGTGDAKGLAEMLLSSVEKSVDMGRLVAQGR